MNGSFGCLYRRAYAGDYLSVSSLRAQCYGSHVDVNVGDTPDVLCLRGASP